MRYIQTTVDSLHKGKHVDAGTVIPFEDDDGAIGNYLASKRGKEIDADEGAKAVRAAAKAEKVVG